MKRGNMKWAMVAFVAGCAGQPVSSEAKAVAEQRLLKPYAMPREVGCSELVVELTANFAANVGRPAVDPARHRVETRRSDGCTETVWTNPTGLPEAAFLVTIGPTPQPTELGWVRPERTTFRVVGQVVLRVFEGRHEMALDAAASGVVLVKDGSGPVREAPAFRIQDGALR